MKFTTGRPKPRLANPLPVIVKLARRASGCGHTHTTRGFDHLVAPKAHYLKRSEFATRFAGLVGADLDGARRKQLAWSRVQARRIPA